MDFQPGWMDFLPGGIISNHWYDFLTLTPFGPSQEASKKITWKGDRCIDSYIYKLTSQLFERIGLRADFLKPWKNNKIIELSKKNQRQFKTSFKINFVSVFVVLGKVFGLQVVQLEILKIVVFHAGWVKLVTFPTFSGTELQKKLNLSSSCCILCVKRTFLTSEIHTLIFFPLFTQGFTQNSGRLHENWKILKEIEEEKNANHNWHLCQVYLTDPV